MSASTLNLVLPEIVDDKYFSNEFKHSVQIPLREHVEGDLQIDLTIVKWINPIALMTILCELESWAYVRSHLSKRYELKIDLGTFQARTSRPAPLFIANHGFIEAIFEVGRASCAEKTYPKISILYKRPTRVKATFYKSNIKNLVAQIRADASACNTNPIYPNEFVFTPYVLAPSIENAHDEQRISKLVERAIHEKMTLIDDTYFEGRSSNSHVRDVTLQRINTVILELSSNSIEHGYRNLKTPRPVCIFIREIEGSDDRNESIYTSADDLSKYLQIFVVDVGRGIAADRILWTQLETELAELDTDSASDLLKRAMNCLFKVPVSSKNRMAPSLSSLTGLRNIDFMLANYLEKTVVAADGWWAKYEHASNAKPQKSSVSDRQIFPNGTFIEIGIKLSPPMEIGAHWATPRIYPNSLPQIRDSAFNERTTVTNQTAVLDSYSNDKLNQTASSLNFSGTTPPKYTIILGKRTLQKQELLRHIENWIQRLSQCSEQEIAHRSLVFIDVSSSQAVFSEQQLAGKLTSMQSQNYSNTDDTKNGRVDKSPATSAPGLLGHVSVGFKTKPQHLSLVLITESLEVCTLGVKITLSSELKNASSSFVRYTFERQVTSEQKFKETLIEVLLKVFEYENETLFKIISEIPGALTKNVVWERDAKATKRELSLPTQIIPNYLDYPLLSQNRKASRIIRKAIRRALALFPTAKVELVDLQIQSDYADAAVRMPDNKEIDNTGPTKRIGLISCLASYQTIKEAESTRGKYDFVLACFRIPVLNASMRGVERDNTLTDYALFSLENMLGSPVKFQFSEGELYWERIPMTPYIRQFVAMNNRGASAPVIQRDSKLWGGAIKRADAYREWDSSRILKLGHWSIDWRHGLLELNYDACLGRHADRYTGFYSWLVKELATVLTNIKDSEESAQLLLIYPVSRRNGKIVHHLRKMPSFSALEARISIQPVSYLPDVGDGIKRLSPHTLSQIRNTKHNYHSLAVFLDIGFVGNRTFRHTLRQLKAEGFSDLLGLGLLNRSSYPGLDSEVHNNDYAYNNALVANAREFDKPSELGTRCYWRLEVPTLDNEKSCPICQALRSLGTLSEYTGHSRKMFSECIARIETQWSLRRTSASWNESGIEPEVVDASILEKFFRDYPEHDFREPSDEEQFAIVNSAQAAAFAIETARSTSDQEFPFIFARYFQRSDNILPAIDILVAYLLLCRHDLHKYHVLEIAKEVISLSIAVTDDRHNKHIPHNVAIRNEMVILVINGLEPDTRAKLIDHYVDLIHRVSINSTQIALLGYSLISANSSNFENLLSSVNTSQYSKEQIECFNRNSLLLWNVRSPEGSHLRKARLLFGARADHGFLLDWVNKIQSISDARRVMDIVCPYIWRDLNAPQLELTPVFQVLYEENSIHLQKILHYKDKMVAEDLNLLEIQDSLKRLQHSFQDCYFRFDFTYDNFEGLQRKLEDIINNESPPYPAEDIQFESVSFRRADDRAKNFKYVLLGRSVETAIRSIVREAMRVQRKFSDGFKLKIALREDSTAPVSGSISYVGIDFSNLSPDDRTTQRFLDAAPLLRDYEQVTDLLTLCKCEVARRHRDKNRLIVSLNLAIYCGGD